MGNIERQVAREVKAMTRREVITKAIDGQLSWVAAADILAITPRQMRRVRRGLGRHGMSAGVDQRGGGAPREGNRGETHPGTCPAEGQRYPDVPVHALLQLLCARHS